MDQEISAVTTCPHCSSSLVRVIDGDVGDRWEYTACPVCEKTFLPGWPERQWAEPESRPVPKALAVKVVRGFVITTEAAQQAA